MVYGYPYDFGDYYGGYGVSIGNEISAALLAVLGLMIVAVAALGITFYLLGAFGLYNIAKRRGMNNAFMAFIPIANTYYLGKLADDINATMNKKTNNAKRILTLIILVLGLGFVAGIVGGVSVGINMLAAKSGMFYSSAIITIFTVLLSIALFACNITLLIFEYIALYTVYKEYSPNNATVFLVLTILFSDAASSIIMFAIRNKKSGYQLWCESKAAEKAAQAASQNNETVTVNEDEYTEVTDDAHVDNDNTDVMQ